MNPLAIEAEIRRDGPWCRWDVYARAPWPMRDRVTLTLRGVMNETYSVRLALNGPGDRQLLASGTFQGRPGHAYRLRAQVTGHYSGAEPEALATLAIPCPHERVIEITSAEDYGSWFQCGGCGALGSGPDCLGMMDGGPIPGPETPGAIRAQLSLGEHYEITRQAARFAATAQGAYQEGWAAAIAELAGEAKPQEPLWGTPHSAQGSAAAPDDGVQDAPAREAPTPGEEWAWDQVPPAIPEATKPGRTWAQEARRDKRQERWAKALQILGWAGMAVGYWWGFTTVTEWLNR